jgi:cholesterol transport system auxiliary component
MTDHARRRGLGAAAALMLGPTAGCTGIGLGNDAPRFEFYMIEDLRAGSASSAANTAEPRLDRTLLVMTGSAPALYDSDRIVFTRDGVGRAYYQHSNWSERPTRRLTNLAEARLASGGGFRAVAQTLAGVRGDQVLSVRLVELVHDDSASPGLVRLSATAELLDWRTRTLAGRRTIATEAAVGARNARGVARAASVAVTEWLDALTPWVESSVAAIRDLAPATPAQRPT